MGWFKKNMDGEIQSENPQFGFSRINSILKYGQSPIYIKRSEFNSLDDVEIIKDELEKGNIMILDTGNLLNSNRISVLELKRAIDQLRGICNDIGGSIGRLGDSLLIITPNKMIKIY